MYQARSSCIICDHDQVQASPTVLADFVWDRMCGSIPKPSFHSLRCDRCLFTWLDHRFTDSQCVEYYRDYGQGQYLSHRVRCEGSGLNSTFKNYHEQLGARQQELASFLSEHGIEITKLDRVLDWGGLGWSVPTARDSMVYDIDSREPAPGWRVWDGQPVDLVICQHVLEHVMDPLVLWRSLCGQGQWVYLEVPSELPNSVQDIVLWHEHVNRFSRQSLEYLARDLGPGHQIGQRSVRGLGEPVLWLLGQTGLNL